MQCILVSHRFRAITSGWTITFLVCAALGCGAGNAERQTTGSYKPLDKPATVDQAAQFLNLEKFPLLKGAKTPNCCRIASLSYEAPGNIQTAFEFQQKQLADQNWKELPNSLVNDQSASATFTRNGFMVSVMVYPASRPGTVMVTLANHGNIELGKLPVPADAKPLYDMPATAAFVTETPVEKTAEECCNLLLAQGWKVYGKAGDSVFFKRNAVRLLANIMAAPAQGGKTVISYSSELLSADLPAPEETQDLRYIDLTKTLLFDSRDSQDKIVSFYLKKLSEDGWQPTTEKPVQIEKKSILIFRNPTHDMLTLELSSLPEDTVQVKLVHLSAAELAALEHKIQEQIKQHNGGEKGSKSNY
jgi:hypothetical protein